MSSADTKDINNVILAVSKEGAISCAEAFTIVNDYSIFPNILGIAIDNNKIRIKQCQLGLFGHGGNKKIKEAETVSEELEDKIFEYLEEKKISCTAVWSIAAEFKISKFEVACACEKLKIKISKCQLGAF